MLVMLDNYDSFTYNLVQYLAELGAELRVVRNDEVTAGDIMATNPDGIVLSPGPGRPEEAGILHELVAAAIGRVPLLGVCLGLQAIAQVYGARIGHAPSLVHGKTSEIRHDGSLLFRGVDSPFVATRYHSLAVERKSLPECLTVNAWTEGGVVMALSHRELPVYGVQFHPESILTVSGKTILANFLNSL
jgi:anthranilate synthase/aminodeoxychorismate synthase-like glutamine amidotransferase